MKDRPNRIFIESEKISKHLYCAICHQVFDNPNRMFCGHTFCYLCIEEWASMSKLCPLCKKSLRSRKPQKDLIAANLIDQFMSQCSHPNCNWTGVYSRLKKHQRICQHRQRRRFEQTRQDDCVRLSDDEQVKENIQQGQRSKKKIKPNEQDEALPIFESSEDEQEMNNLQPLISNRNYDRNNQNNQITENNVENEQELIRQISEQRFHSEKESCQSSILSNYLQVDVRKLIKNSSNNNHSKNNKINNNNKNTNNNNLTNKNNTNNEQPIICENNHNEDSSHSQQHISNKLSNGIRDISFQQEQRKQQMPQIYYQVKTQNNRQYNKQFNNNGNNYGFYKKKNYHNHSGNYNNYKASPYNTNNIFNNHNHNNQNGIFNNQKNNNNNISNYNNNNQKYIKDNYNYNNNNFNSNYNGPYQLNNNNNNNNKKYNYFQKYNNHNQFFQIINHQNYQPGNLYLIQKEREKQKLRMQKFYNNNQNQSKWGKVHPSSSSAKSSNINNLQLSNSSSQSNPFDTFDQNLYPQKKQKKQKRNKKSRNNFQVIEIDDQESNFNKQKQVNMNYQSQNNENDQKQSNLNSQQQSGQMSVGSKILPSPIRSQINNNKVDNQENYNQLYEQKGKNRYERELSDQGQQIEKQQIRFRSNKIQNIKNTQY